jgi:hypothetical protein
VSRKPSATPSDEMAGTPKGATPAEPSPKTGEGGEGPSGKR